MAGAPQPDSSARTDRKNAPGDGRGGEALPAALLITGGDVVTMNARREVLVGGTVVIAGDRILAVGSTPALRSAYPDAAELDASGCIVTPGLINAHQHLTGDPLVRSCIPDLLTSGESIFSWSVPLHAEHTPDDDELSATLTAAQSALCGVTTLVEAGTVANPGRVAAGMAAVGVRGTVGTWGWDIDDAPFAAPPDEVLDRQRQVLAAHPPGGLVEGWVTLVGHDLASDELLVGAADLARGAGCGMTMHISPTSSDPESYLRRRGVRPLVHFDRLGILGRHLLLAHGVWLDDTEVELVLGSETAIAYCPWAYLRLGQGVTAAGRHLELARRGGRLALGCDAGNAGDLPDVLRAAALAAGLARDMPVDPEGFGAHDAFELATIRGAEAIGKGAEIGSLEVGKLADVVVFDCEASALTPRGDVALQLVWGSDGRDVRDVFVGGRPVVRDGRCTTLDVDELRLTAATAQRDLLRRAGIEVPHTWPRVPSG
ncbi:MAG: amidohydrolase family protein [Acidimicrobiia bacterium]|nr:amidohydrolase family protein [Acidimicrobiia bacterium]MYC45003.1 amidohydrolase family protein [Acidimicrobiia bacterium]